MNRLLFVPLDDRPATRESVLDLLPLLGVPWATPPRELLGHRRQPADLDGLWRWVEREAVAADALVASAEVLLHGGLVASRLSVEPLEALWARLDRLLRLAGRVPTYLSAVNPRIPAGGADEEPVYWGPYGDALRVYSSRLDAGEQTGDDARVRDARRALETVPAPVVDDLLRRRRRQLLLNVELMLAAAQGTLQALLIGQDDAEPYGLPRADLAVLRRLRARLGTPRVSISAGADELNARLVARLANDAAGRGPRVHQQFDQERLPLSCLQVAQLHLQIALALSRRRDLRDERDHAPHVARRDPSHHAQDELRVAHNGGLHPFERPLEDLLHLIRRLDQVGEAVDAALASDGVEQIGVPVFAQAQGEDRKPQAARFGADLPALAFVAMGLAIGEQQQTADAPRVERLSRLIDAQPHPARHLGAPAVANALYQRLQVLAVD